MLSLVFLFLRSHVDAAAVFTLSYHKGLMINTKIYIAQKLLYCLLHAQIFYSAHNARVYCCAIRHLRNTTMLRQNRGKD